MNFSRNIIFITCLLSGICYSQLAPHRVPGSSFFLNPGTRTVNPAPTTDDITRKLAEELLCGDSTGWAANFLNVRQNPLKNPCGMGKCRVNDLMTDFKCECFPGYKFNEQYGGVQGLVSNPRTCVKSKSLVTCKPGSQRVAAEQLIVGIFDDPSATATTPALFPWVGGVYERVAGTGYQNTDDEIYNPATNIYQRGHPQETHIQQYRHNVPLKGREYYEKYEVDPTDCKVNRDKVIATLSYNYEENQWQFNSTEIDPATNALKHSDENLKVYARSIKKCVEDVTSWTYTYDLSGRINVGTHFIKKGILSVDETKFQIRDMEALKKADRARPNLSTTTALLSKIREKVYPSSTYTCSAADSYLQTIFKP